MKLAAFFISSNRRSFTKMLGVSESSINKVRSHWTVQQLSTVIYFSSYFQDTAFALKRDCLISAKLQML